mmetsp:Transcript_992/g.2673  ORF Transcript_992/g.2673 Transcript_992/m.2673 type:complete len:392 (+) Transcript_992:2-1177(+)
MWLVGVGAIVVGCFCSAIGLVLMKASTQQEAHLPWHARKRWALGFVFLVVNATVCDTLALALAPLSLLGPFAGLTIVFSTLLAQHGAIAFAEAVAALRWASIGVIIVGVGLVSAFGPHSTMPVTEENVYRLLTNTSFVVFGSVSAAAIISVVIIWVVGHDFVHARAVVPLLAYAAASCGALSLCFLKVLSMALAGTVTGESPGELFSAHCAFSLLAILIMAPLQLALLNSCLVRSPVSYAVPLYESLLIILTVTAGGTFYQEFEHYKGHYFFGFIAGVVLTIAGLVLLASSDDGHHSVLGGDDEASDPDLEPAERARAREAREAAARASSGDPTKGGYVALAEPPDGFANGSRANGGNGKAPSTGAANGVGASAASEHTGRNGNPLHKGLL